jgi:hypothetical protein
MENNRSVSRNFSELPLLEKRGAGGVHTTLVFVDLVHHVGN